MLKALIKRLFGGQTVSARLRRTTLVRVRYELGLGLKKLKMDPYLGERDTPKYLMMLKHVENAIKILKDDHEMIEDFKTPADLQRTGMTSSCQEAIRR